MRRFLTGLMLGWATMYWYAYEKDTTLQSLSGWFAQASHDAGAPKKIDQMFHR
ncbi:MAG TPA: hypothetical protein VGK30_07870 [Candidatus Binatia bacterium]|jgi:hypothetical protein